MGRRQVNSPSIKKLPNFDSVYFSSKNFLSKKAVSDLGLDPVFSIIISAYQFQPFTWTNTECLEEGDNFFPVFFFLLL